MNDKNIKAVVVNADGEITNTYFLGDRVKVTRRESVEMLNNTVELNKNEDYVKVYRKSLFELSKRLTGTESQFINYLCNYIRYRSGILAHDNGKPLKRQTMCTDTGLNIKTIDRILSSLISKQVLGKHKTGHVIIYTANPYIFMRGSRINTTLQRFFEKSKWARLFK